MALFTPSLSPAITVREVDLTGTVPNVSTTTGAIVGDFRWGPVAEPTLVNGETALVSAFGAPSTGTAVDFLSAASFLRYSDSLYVTREVVDSDGTLAGNITSNAFDYSTDSDGQGLGYQSVLVKNLDDFNAVKDSIAANGTWAVAKWPGAAGSSLAVSICPADSDNSTFDGWSYKDNFDGAPGTSSYVANLGGSNDEVHVAIIDSDGTFSGVKGSVLETFSYVSLAGDAKTTDGATNYLEDVLNNRSNYVWAVDAPKVNGTAVDTDWGKNAAGVEFGLQTPKVYNTGLGGGKDSPTLNSSAYLRGFDTFEDQNTIEIDFMIAPGMNSKSDQVTVVNHMVGLVAGANGRKDCVVVASPNRNAVVNNSAANILTDTLSTVNDYTYSSYLVTDNNYLKMYDKYNDQYIFVPAASSTAGVMAGTDASAAPWFSPAGQRRGLYFGVTSLAYNASKTDRDALYKVGINPIVNLPGQGILLFGDKTKESRPSAFDRINVRRLFLVVERAIKEAARNVMFEFNDEFTRAEFVNIVEPFLREIQGRRGITDFRVVCDETNNTADVIDSNRFVASIFIKPARSINYVTLNFVAVRTGVEFEEVTGSV